MNTMIDESRRLQGGSAGTVTQTSTQHGHPTPVMSTGNYRAGIDQVRFWVGAGLTAVIAAMTAVVGLLLIRTVLDVPVLVSSSHPLDITAYALVTAAIVIGASALYNLMLYVAPHPTTYYGALAAVGTALAVLLPFTVPVGLVSQAALAGLNLVIGLVVAFLVPMAAVGARR